MASAHLGRTAGTPRKALSWSCHGRSPPDGVPRQPQQVERPRWMQLVTVVMRLGDQGARGGWRMQNCYSGSTYPHTIPMLFTRVPDLAPTPRRGRAGACTGTARRDGGITSSHPVLRREARCSSRPFASSTLRVRASIRFSMDDVDVEVVGMSALASVSMGAFSLMICSSC